MKLVLPKLSVVGAGPGDPQLITLKGVKTLQQADVVLYDALVNPELLKHASAEAIKIFVGKRKGRHEYSQEEINNLIVDMAFTHGHVVRLKGGDPFVFGRGMEEIQHAAAFNIDTVVIPGISSSIGVPGANGIPVTHRSLSESFWVVTGTAQNGELSGDVEKAAQSRATVVILMGLSKLKEIADVFIAAGRGAVPVAVIQSGTLANEKVALGQINTIVKEVQSKRIGSPALIVIGEVVKFHQHYGAYAATLNYSLN